MGYNNLIYLLYFDLLNFQLYILCSIFINFILICIKGKCSILSGPTMGTTRSGPMKAQRKPLAWGRSCSCRRGSSARPPLLRRPSAAAPWEARRRRRRRLCRSLQPSRPSLQVQSNFAGRPPSFVVSVPGFEHFMRMKLGMLWSVVMFLIF